MVDFECVCPLQEDLLAESRAAYQREAVERRRLHNLVQELRGNIRVRRTLTRLLHELGVNHVSFEWVNWRWTVCFQQLRSKCMLTIDK